MGFTKGPWEIGACGTRIMTGYRDKYGNMTDENWHPAGHPKTVAVCEYKKWMEGYEENDSNLRLISAAPDMYEALVRMVEGPYLTDRDKQIAWAALAKARGEG